MRVVVPLSADSARPQPAAQPAPKLDLNQSKAFKDKALRSLGELPPFSPILNRLLASLANEEVDFAKLGDLIEKDTVVAGNVLHLVNSALYGRSGTINSVRHAVSLLGISKLRNAVLGMSISRMWNRVRPPASWSMARFNLHSAAAAMLSDMLAQALPVAYPEGAFVAGLLHDVGRLLIAMGLPEEHSKILAAAAKGEASHLECEIATLGFGHPELSAQALAFWNLPEPICVAVRDHHVPIAADSGRNSNQIPLAHVVRVASEYVNTMGAWIVAPKEPVMADPTLLEPLGLTPDRIQKLLTDFKTEHDSMVPFFR